MPQTTWQRLCKSPETLHLIAAALPAGRDARRDAWREELIGRLVAALKPKGTWAMRPVATESEVQVAFGRRGDAERVAVVTEARPTGRYPDWASQRRFVLDRAAEAKFAKIVGST
jgi:hypothetical protein